MVRDLRAEQRERLVAEFEQRAMELWQLQQPETSPFAVESVIPSDRAMAKAELNEWLTHRSSLIMALFNVPPPRRVAFDARVMDWDNAAWREYLSYPHWEAERCPCSKFHHATRLRNAMTNAERTLWHSLEQRVGGYRFAPQVIVRGWIVDFLAIDAGLAVEVDGQSHLERRAYDEVRDGVLNRAGIRVERFDNDEIAANLDSVLTRIAHAVSGPTLWQRLGIT